MGVATEEQAPIMGCGCGEECGRDFSSRKEAEKWLITGSVSGSCEMVSARIKLDLLLNSEQQQAAGCSSRQPPRPRSDSLSPPLMTSAGPNESFDFLLECFVHTAIMFHGVLT